MNSPVDYPNEMVLPFSEDAEQSVLGAVLLGGAGVLDMIEQPLRAEDFFVVGHGLIWAAIARLVAADKPADLITVTEALRDGGLLDKVGGAAYVGELSFGAPSDANVDAYAQIIHHHRCRRIGITIASDIKQLALAGSTQSADDFALQVEQMIMPLSTGQTGGWESIADVAARQMKTLDELLNGDRKMVGLSTGFAELDAIVLGLQKGDLVILGGRPSMGKTQLAVDAISSAIFAGGSAGIFTMEMPNEQIFTRMAAGASTTQLMRLRQGSLNADEQQRFFAAATELSTLNCWMDQTGRLTAQELRRRARQLASKAKAAGAPLQLLVVDYLQLAEGSSGGGNRTNDVGEISRSLKAIAKELAIPVLALSQLNRGLEQRTDKRPKLSDLRESGAIEQDADVIMFVYRDVVYNDDADPGAAEVIVAKQRNGPTGTAHLRWVPNVPRFAN